MKRTLLTLFVVLLAAGAAFAGVTKEDLKKLVSAGVTDDVILAFVQANGPVDSLSADDLIELKKAGASDKLLQAVLAKPEKPQEQPPARPQPAAQQAPPATEPQRVVERQTVYAEPVRTTYDYAYPPVTYDYYYPSTVTPVYCCRHRTYDRCTAYTTSTYYPSYAYTYSYAYPSCRYTSYGYSGYPSYSYYYSGSRCGRGSSVKIRW